MNNATYGGGFYGFGSIEDTVIEENNATFGGGIYFLGSPKSLKNITVFNNKAQFGGGMYLDSLLRNFSYSLPLLITNNYAS